MMENKFCEHCGSAMEPDDLFCPYCGQKVTDINIEEAGQIPGAPGIPEPPEISEFAQPPFTPQPPAQQPFGQQPPA